MKPILNFKDILITPCGATNNLYVLAWRKNRNIISDGLKMGKITATPALFLYLYFIRLIETGPYLNRPELTPNHLILLLFEN